MNTSNLNATIRNVFFALTAATTLAVAVAVPAYAQDAQTTTVHVYVKDLDLRTAAGADTLRQRVVMASGQVCGEAATLGNPGYQNYESCVQNARTAALQRSDAMIASVRGAYHYASNTQPKA